MSSDDSVKLERIARQVTEIHTAIFGHEGQGGLHRWVSDLDKAVDELRQAEARILGISVGASTAVCIVGWIITTMWRH